MPEVTAEVFYRGTINQEKDNQLLAIAKRFSGEWIGSGVDTPMKGKQQDRNNQFEFPSRGRALGFFKAVRKKIKGIGKMFVRKDNG
ncbi:hypothetical protein LCGC14_0422050 [marine sediment metagenome]|uniref:Uncharacterized protein n=1 Tax=marine sediment metagenome TaxID=412755 RepID=A0A0F9SQK5_9ZZZZ